MNQQIKNANGTVSNLNVKPLTIIVEVENLDTNEIVCEEIVIDARLNYVQALDEAAPIAHIIMESKGWNDEDCEWMHFEA